MPELVLEKFTMGNPDQIFIQLEIAIPEPPVRQAAVKVDPDIGPSDRFDRAMAVPFPWLIEQRVAGAQTLPALLGLQLTFPARDERQAKFTQHPPLLPFEAIVRWMAGAGIGLVRPDRFPAGMRDVKRLLKEPVIQRQGMSAGIEVSHFELI